MLLRSATPISILIAATHGILMCHDDKVQWSMGDRCVRELDGDHKVIAQFSVSGDETRMVTGHCVDINKTRSRCYCNSNVCNVKKEPTPREEQGKLFCGVRDDTIQGNMTHCKEDNRCDICQCSRKAYAYGTPCKLECFRPYEMAIDFRHDYNFSNLIVNTCVRWLDAVTNTRDSHNCAKRLFDEQTIFNDNSTNGKIECYIGAGPYCKTPNETIYAHSCFIITHDNRTLEWGGLIYNDTLQPDAYKEKYSRGYDLNNSAQLVFLCNTEKCNDNIESMEALIQKDLFDQSGYKTQILLWEIATFVAYALATLFAVLFVVALRARRPETMYDAPDSASNTLFREMPQALGHAQSEPRLTEGYFGSVRRSLSAVIPSCMRRSDATDDYEVLDEENVEDMDTVESQRHSASSSEPDTAS